MSKLSKHQQALLVLVKAGLWEIDVRLSHLMQDDFSAIKNLAEEHSVVGLVTAGLEHVVNLKLPKEVILQFVGSTLQIEQKNTTMNCFIQELVGNLRKADVYSVLVKGQGIAQCYVRPQWRSCGDVDLLLSEENYLKAKECLMPLASGVVPERNYSKELGLYIKNWFVELHGTQRTGLSRKVDIVVDEVQRDIFYGGNVRSWMNGKNTVFLPSPNNDVFFVFTHYIKHFYKEGLQLKQVCDWCRLLWTYRDSLNIQLLEKRLQKAGLLSEWKGFAAVAVDYLGMPADVMPLYSNAKKWGKKAEKIIAFVLSSGEWHKWHDTFVVSKTFPLSVLRFTPGILLNINMLKVKERLFKK